MPSSADAPRHPDREQQGAGERPGGPPDQPAGPDRGREHERQTQRPQALGERFGVGL